MSQEYLKTREKLRELQQKAAAGDKQAFKDKITVGNEVREIEREAARAGTVLTAIPRGDKLVIEAKQGRSKRSQQEEYISKFDPEVTADIGGKEQTLQEYHSKRLLGK